MRLLIVILAVTVAIIAAGLTGLLFVLWPTSLNDRAIAVTNETLARLTEIRKEQKFQADPENLYFGTMSEQDRVLVEAYANASLDVIVRDVKASPRKSTVLAAMKASLAGFPSSESEERDRYLFQLERVLRTLEIPRSDELFNVWRYGFPYGWFVSSK